MEMVVLEVIAFDLSSCVGYEQPQRKNEEDFDFDKVVGSAESLRTHESDKSKLKPRFGLTNLSALLLLKRLITCFGYQILKVMEEADLGKILLDLYAVFPFNDMALSLTTEILAYMIDAEEVRKIAKELK